VLVLETVVFECRDCLLDDTEPNNRSSDGLKAAVLAPKPHSAEVRKAFLFYFILSIFGNCSL
jgi:hypothetical protein